MLTWSGVSGVKGREPRHQALPLLGDGCLGLGLLASCLSVIPWSGKNPPMAPCHPHSELSWS